MTDSNFKKTCWEDASRRWVLGTMAEHMFNWLKEKVKQPDGSDATVKGYQLVGTLDPDNPSTDNIPMPPEWMNPEISMKGMCAWSAEPMQNYLFGQGLIPLVRFKVDNMGNIVADTLRGAVPADCITLGSSDDGTGLISGQILIDQKKSPYPLTDAASIVISPVSSDLSALGAQPVQVIEYEEGGDKKGWKYSLTGLAGAYIYIYA